MKLLLASLCSLFSLYFFRFSAYGASCCGGGFATPSVITGDDRAQATTSYSQTEIAIDNVDSNGIWRRSRNHQEIKTFKIEAAHILADRWQAGLSVPVMQRKYHNQQYSGLADVTGMVGYEYLPGWTYSLYRPKGVGFLQLTLPTGKSRAESEIGGLDSRGNGFWALGIGTLLTKGFGHWDLLASFEVHRSFSKNISNSQINGMLKPGLGGQLVLGGGYSFKNNWRLGTSFTWNYEDAVEFEGNIQSAGSVERYATAQFSLNYLINVEWACTLSYADQTLLGTPVNTSLGKTYALQLQRRWSR